MLGDKKSYEGLAVARIARDAPFPIPPEIPASSYLGDALSESSKDIHLSNAPCDHNAQTSQIDGH